MVGPCLCGDPYCGSCGNPSEAAYADYIDGLLERIDEKKMDEFELDLFEKVGFAAVDCFRERERDRKYEPIFE